MTTQTNTPTTDAQFRTVGSRPGTVECLDCHQMVEFRSMHLHRCNPGPEPITAPTPPAHLYHHQSAPGGPVKCRQCQQFTPDWTTHSVAHTLDGATVHPDRDVLANTVLAVARTIRNLRDPREPDEVAYVMGLLYGLYDMATHLGKDDVAEGLGDCLIAWTEGTCSTPDLVWVLRGLAVPAP
jgi:hypothetical protein